MISQYDILYLGPGLPRPSGSVGGTLPGYADLPGGSVGAAGWQGGLPAVQYAQGPEERRHRIEEWRSRAIEAAQETRLGALPIGDGTGVAPGYASHAWLGPGGMGRGMPGAYASAAPFIAPVIAGGVRVNPRKVAMPYPGEPVGELPPPPTAAEIFGAPPAPVFAAPGGSVAPGIRTPFGEVTEVYQPVERDYAFEATGFRRSWGEPRPKMHGFVWNPLRFVYEPTKGPVYANPRYPHFRETETWRENTQRAHQGIFLQPFRQSVDDSAPWQYRWVRVYTPWPSMEKPYTYYAAGDAFRPPEPPRSPPHPAWGTSRKGQVGAGIPGEGMDGLEPPLPEFSEEADMDVGSTSSWQTSFAKQQERIKDLQQGIVKTAFEEEQERREEMFGW